MNITQRPETCKLSFIMKVQKVNRRNLQVHHTDKVFAMFLKKLTIVGGCLLQLLNNITARSLFLETEIYV